MRSKHLRKANPEIVRDDADGFWFCASGSRDCICVIRQDIRQYALADTDDGCQLVAGR
jgi:hypothetical protein